MASNPDRINIFFTGSTGNKRKPAHNLSFQLNPCITFPGYVGGSVLAKLLEHENRSKFHITALLRAAEKAPILREHNIEPLLGSNEDLDKLETAAANSDVVFSIVSDSELSELAYMCDVAFSSCKQLIKCDR
jgi:hypothetical protein